MSSFHPRTKARGEPPSCPFCGKTVARPRPLELDDYGTAVPAGRCGCGTLYLLDATGREGGQLLMDGLSVLCDGDMDRAVTLAVGVDYLLEYTPYNQKLHIVEAKRRGRLFGQSKLWFIKLVESSGA
jgi:hypothetical protein